MNIELVKALKPSMNKISGNNASKAKDLLDKDKSFSKSLNEFLGKNNLKDKKDLGRVDKDKGTKDIKKDKQEDNFSYLGVLNTEPLMTNKYPGETVLNTESGLELLINPEAEMEGLVGTAVKNLDLFGDELRLLAEGENETSSQNFNLADAKMNLHKALGRESEVKIPLEVETIVGESLKTSELEGLNLDKSLIGSELIVTLGEAVSKESLNKEGGVEVLEELLQVEDVLGKDKGLSKSKLTTNLEGVISKEALGKTDMTQTESDGLELESIDFDKLLDKPLKADGSEEELEEAADTKILETPRSLETNFMMNRIQNSFISQEDLKGVMSPENLQSVQDETIHFMKVSKEGDASVMRVKIYPEELGSIDISLKFQNGKLMADIIVQSEAIKEMFLNGSSLLNKNLLEQNIPVKNINVTVNENLNSFENSSSETGQGKEGQTNRTRNLNRSDVGNNNINQNPIDDMRIDSINKTNKGLNILV